MKRKSHVTEKLRTETRLGGQRRARDRQRDVHETPFTFLMKQEEE